jgi:hypothetical protein
MAAPDLNLANLPALVTGTADSLDIVLLSVTAGSSIVVYAQCQSVAIRSFTVEDDLGNTYTEVGSYAAGKSQGCFLATGVAAGTTTITVTLSTSAVAFQIQAYEILNEIAVDTFSRYLALVSSNLHYAADETGADIAANALVFVWSRNNSTCTDMVVGTGYTEIIGDTRNYLAYRTTDAPLDAHRGSWTSTGTARTEQSMMASFVTLGASDTGLEAYCQEIEGN